MCKALFAAFRYTPLIAAKTFLLIIILCCSHDCYFNEHVYQRRIEISAETFFLDAQHRGEESDKDVFVHIVGLGLGVWMRCSGIQRELYLKAFQAVLQAGKYPRIKDVYFR